MLKTRFAANTVTEEKQKVRIGKVTRGFNNLYSIKDKACWYSERILTETLQMNGVQLLVLACFSLYDLIFNT